MISSDTEGWRSVDKLLYPVVEITTLFKLLRDQEKNEKQQQKKQKQNKDPRSVDTN